LHAGSFKATYVDQCGSPDVVGNALERELEGVAQKSSLLVSSDLTDLHDFTHVKSPVASLCFDCSSVRKRVRVMMSVLIASCLFCCSPLVAMMVVIVVLRVLGVSCGQRGVSESVEEGEEMKRSKQEKSEEVHDHRRVGKAPAVIMKSDVWVQVGRVGHAETSRYLFGRHVGWTAVDSCPRQVTSPRYLSHWSSGGASIVAEELAESSGEAD
jgi:hypothetical protein